jgi:hypothetical protein
MAVLLSALSIQPILKLLVNFNVIFKNALYYEIRPQPAWKEVSTENMEVNPVGGKTG